MWVNIESKNYEKIIFVFAARLVEMECKGLDNVDWQTTDQG
jgi:hypothetical protein